MRSLMRLKWSHLSNSDVCAYFHTFFVIGIDKVNQVNLCRVWNDVLNVLINQIQFRSFSQICVHI